MLLIGTRRVDPSNAILSSGLSRRHRRRLPSRLHPSPRRRRVAARPAAAGFDEGGSGREGGAVADYFLKLDGIAGESVDAKHKDEIELVSFSWGVTQQLVTEGSGGASVGRAQFKDFE